MTDLNLAFALTTIAVIARHWLRERRARLGDRCQQVLGDKAHELLDRVEQRQEQQGDTSDDAIVRLLNGEHVAAPIQPSEFVVVPRRGRDGYCTYEPDQGPRSAA